MLFETVGIIIGCVLLGTVKVLCKEILIVVNMQAGRKKGLAGLEHSFELRISDCRV